VRFDLCRGVLRGPLLYDGRTHESTTPLQSAPLPAGALRLADLGFFDLEALAQIGAQDGYWLSRLHFTTAVYDAQGRRWDVLDLLTAQGAGVPVDLPIALGAQQRLPARLLAVRVPQEVADQRRRCLRATARDRGRTPSAARLAWCDCTLLVTNVPPDLLSLREALVLARARWQIELLFKLWKSHGHIDESRSGMVALGLRLSSPARHHVGPIIEHWDGRAWHISRGLDVPHELGSIAVVSSRDVWAAGGDVIEHWDGAGTTGPPGPAFRGWALTWP
jgi:Transposase DDE domain